MKTLLSLVNLGVEHTQNKPDAFRLRMVNICCLFAIIVTTINQGFVLFNQLHLWSYSLVFILPVPLFMLILWLHKKGRFQLGGIIVTLVPLISNILGYYSFNADVDYELIFLTLSVSTFITIYKSRWLTALFFFIYLSMFLIAAFSDPSTVSGLDIKANEHIKLSIYVVSAIMLPLYCFTIYYYNELGLLELQESKQQLVETAKDLEKSDRLKSAFLANMSHEIRTPMNGILGFSKLLVESDLEEEQAKFASIVHEGSKQLLGVVNDILDFSKIETGQEIISEEPLDVPKLVEGMRALFEQAAKSKGLECNCNFPKKISSLIIRTDAKKVRQILTNLVNNAIKFTEQGSVTLHISLSENKRYISFAIQDTGIGIAVEDQAKIFNRFQQAQLAKGQLIEGTGLGLTISKSYAELLGGSLTLRSTLDAGSTFTLTIPYRPLEEHEALAHSSDYLQEALVRDCTILLAEDVLFNRLLIEKLLENSKATLYCVQDGKAAVDFLDAQMVHLILMDIKMPIMDGREAMQHIKKNHPNIPIIALTAFGMNDEKIALLQAGFDGFISKPVQGEELIQAINTLLLQSTAD